MDWKLHMMIPLFVYIAIILFFQPPLIYSIQALILLIFSSFLPEFDHPRSLARKVFFILLFYFVAIAIMIELKIEFWLKILIISMFLIVVRYIYKKLPIRHRGKRSLHLWRYFFVFPTIFALYFVFAGVDLSLIFFIFIGYGLHLALDKINKF